ncbi:metal ABC transporter solute-binding protein, Zn/Mn family [Candidatus Galacturonibacter soehngenii]|uniref:Manganese transporter n=1 Tax=Candidatus Galacturonatibacter soehngenii TaxID=2307010 RepID=A0A7V7UAT4_9FIRM|nr:zinc ABC transporter substrate-binding protein [Candidatus Galacturonibacter soehngenii]KAB1435783.1 manganese transporter [Candidatus Galacturonibacter soehngenii]MBA4686523.1 zinc ABC transporter substrate-binding protein [Candidatus Galacturonibacter soehngenii]
MKKNFKSILGIILCMMLLLPACSNQTANITSSKSTLNIVATTTMLADLSKNIGGDRVTVDGLMGPGIDPHLYQASAGDVTLMQKAQIVVYNGLHLEGKMGEIFENLNNQKVICIGEGLDPSMLLKSETNSKTYDPHIWFDVTLWKQAAQIVANGFKEADPEYASLYDKNLSDYLKKLEELNLYIQSRTTELSKEQRVLVTAHDAFQYFGKAYGFEVKGLQGISTDAEAGTADVSSLADFIVERQIKAIFVESSIPPKTIEALQSAVKAKGFDVVIGGELYSDSLGDESLGAASYILTFRSNIDTIVDALK